MNFAIYFAGDAYSTSKKIMGRQAAGQSFLRGLARTWPRDPVHGLVHEAGGGAELAQQLGAAGYGGQVRQSILPNWGAASAAGSVYYPAPPPRDFALSRTLISPSSFSIFGVTHTLSSHGAMDQVADLLFPPFQPWDALICTSSAAHTFICNLQDEVRAYWREMTGASRFVEVELPIIPLGVDAPAFVRTDADRVISRQALGLSEDEVVFLFAGRLSFHAKANPAPLYQALEKAAAGRRIVCIEAGLHPNDVIRDAFVAAQRVLAPSVRFIHVDGRNDQAYRNAWRGADVFASLSDNIQETFGLTPVEAMAAGLPVIVSDWNGYRDTIRDGVDGFRIPTIAPQAGAGADLATRFALGVDNYDYFIGRTSLATVVDPQAAAQVVEKLAGDEGLRRRMGEAGRRRAEAEYDWPVILAKYSELVGHLNERRRHAGASPAVTTPQRADPFHRFSHFPSFRLGEDWIVSAQPGAAERTEALLDLAMANYAFNREVLPVDGLRELAAAITPGRSMRLGDFLGLTTHDRAVGMRLVMWLWKFDVISARPPS